MSKKRTPEGSSDDSQTSESTDVFHSEAKRGKLDIFSDATLEDLPNELLTGILVKAVLLEVEDMKLIKSVWKEKADLVISRLGTVCSLWSEILANSFFRNKVHEILDRTAQETFRLEILYQCLYDLSIVKSATTKDEVFMLCRPNNQASFINVHNRNNMNTVNDVIHLPGIHPVDMAANSLSNCVYVLNKDPHCYSVLRITKDETNQFNVSLWIDGLSTPCCYKRLYAAVNGGLIILSHQMAPTPSVVSIYDASGSLQHVLTLSPATYGFGNIFCVIQKSSGNLVLAIRSVSNTFHTVLIEIDTTGRIVRQYRSSMPGYGNVNVAGAHGRIWLFGQGYKGEVLDFEFNLLDLADPPKEVGKSLIFSGTHTSSASEEIASFYHCVDGILTIFRFTAK